MDEWLAYEMRCKTSMSECFKTPVYVRRFRLDRFKKLDESKEEEMEETRNSVSRNGKRQSKLSGDELKAKLKNNEINPDNVG